MKNTFGTKAAEIVDGHGCTLMYYNGFWWIIIPAKKLHTLLQSLKKAETNSIILNYKHQKKILEGIIKNINFSGKKTDFLSK